MTGSVQARAQIQLMPKVSGRLEKLLVNVGDAVHAGVHLLGAAQNGGGVEVPLRALDHLQNDAALASQADAAVPELALQPADGFVGVDALSGGNAVGGPRRAPELAC